MRRPRRDDWKQPESSSDGASLSLPFAHLNLRRNPFGAPTAEERAELAVIAHDLNGNVEQLQRPGHALQFTGKKGRGKSTHLLALHAYFPDAPFTYVPEDGPIPSVPDTPVQYVVEMQRIPYRRRRSIFARPASFVIGSHKDHRREFRRAGLTYEHFILKGLMVEKLMEIIQRRIDWARRDTERLLPSVSEATAAKLIAAYGDDIRAIEDHLYDLFQELGQPMEV